MTVLRSSWVLLTVIAFAGCASALREPANLDPHKDALRHYYTSGAYLRDVSTVAGSAGAWIDARVARRSGGERLSIVLDIDDTVLSSWPYLQQYDFGGNYALWDAWVETATAPAIEPVMRVYAKARERSVGVFFLTARPEHQRAATERNLRAMGCGGYAALICKPDADQRTSAAYKTAERQKLAQQGWTVIASVGDQASDLVGGFAERTFKLPDPFYLTP